MRGWHAGARHGRLIGNGRCSTPSSGSSSGARSRRPSRSTSGSQDGRARGVLLGRDLLDGVRDRGDPVRHRGRRGDEPRARPRPPRPDRDRGRAPASRSSSRRTARRSTPTRRAARAYIVSRENHGEMPSLVAGASLLVDYILTVAVSVSAGVAAIISIPQFHDTVAKHRVAVALVIIVLISLANLRGIKESGPALRDPDVRLHRRRGRAHHARADEELLRLVRRRRARCPFDPEPGRGAARDRRHARSVPHPEGLLVGRGRAHRHRGDLRRRARVPAAGSEERGARRSRSWARSSARCSSACRCSRHHLHPYPSHDVTVFAQMGKQVFGDGAAFWVLQILTAGILILAANTAYADFPRLSSIVARDGYLPRQLATRGDRLVFSNGIVVLAVMAERADRRVRRHHERADPAVRGRRVHVVHAVAVRHGAPPPARAQRRTGSVHAVISGVGATRDVRRAAHRRRHEVHERRVDPARRHPRDRAAVQGDQAALRRGRRGPAGRRRATSPAA